jgi:hypothetical protein
MGGSLSRRGAHRLVNHYPIVAGNNRETIPPVHLSFAMHFSPSFSRQA